MTIDRKISLLTYMPTRTKGYMLHVLVFRFHPTEQNA